MANPTFGKPAKHVPSMSVTSPTFQGLYQFQGLASASGSRKQEKNDNEVAQTLFTVSSVSMFGKEQENANLTNQSFQDNWLSARSDEKVPGKIARTNSKTRV
jgi:hypothetical protein